jgi:hypothetical protein
MLEFERQGWHPTGTIRVEASAFVPPLSYVLSEPLYYRKLNGLFGV